MLECISIIGMGLIGGSIARSLRKHQQVTHIIAYDRDTQALQTALELGVIDEIAADIKQAAQADVIMLAVPMGAMRSVLQDLQPHLGKELVLTDAGSSKQSFIDDVISVFGTMPANIVPGHPIAGTEKSGVENALDDLFEKRRVILTPEDNCDAEAFALVKSLWQGIGAEVETMSARHHDEVLAATSHVPHLLAYALVDCLGTMNERVEIFKFAAGGFRDFTRIASSDPIMWKDICVNNEKAIISVLERLEKELHGLKQHLQNDNGEALEKVFRRAKSLRDQFVVGVEV